MKMVKLTKMKMKMMKIKMKMMKMKMKMMKIKVKMSMMMKKKVSHDDGYFLMKSEQHKLRDRGTGGHRQRRIFIDNQGLKHTQFCREIRFVAIYALFGGLSIENLVSRQKICSIDRTDFLQIENLFYRQTRFSIDRTNFLSIENNSIDRINFLSIEHIFIDL